MKEKKSLLKRFNSLPTVNKIFVIILILFVIMLIVGIIIYQFNQSKSTLLTSNFIENQNNSNSKNSNLTTTSENFYGMRFNQNISTFCESYNESLKDCYEQVRENYSELYELKPSDFSYYTTVSESNLREYVAKGINYQIILFLENDSDYIVNACVAYNKSGVANQNDFLSFISSKIYPATVMGLVDCSYSDVLNIIMEVADSNNNIIYKDNVSYYITSDSSNSNLGYMYVNAISRDKYNEFSSNSSSQTSNTTTTNSTNLSASNNTTTANTTSNTIENGTYNKILTSEEKDDGFIQLGDISITIQGNTITLTDVGMQCKLTGTYTIEDGKLVGEYTTAEYYSHDEMKDITQTIEDRFEFEIQEDNKLYDTMGYGQFLGKCLYRNATYELVQ